MLSPRRLGFGAAVLLAAASLHGSAALGAAPASTSIFVDAAAFPTIAVSVVLPRESTTPPVVYENGLPVKLLGAVNVGRSATAVVAVDHSQSMRGAALRTARGVALELLLDRQRGERLALVSIASKAVRLAPFSRNSAAGEKALSKLRVDRRYGTALFDGVVLAANALKHEPGTGKVIFLVTDGQGTTGTADIGAAAAAASSAHASVYPVMIDSATYLPRTLRELSRATQGAFLGAETRSGSTDYSAIASDVRRTWRIVYTTTAGPGTTISLKVAEPHAPAVTASAVMPGKAPATSFFKSHGLVIAGIAIFIIVSLVFLISRRPSKRA
jgi:von Willebrand factor type A domain